jgi:hypothetical protein
MGIIGSGSAEENMRFGATQLLSLHEMIRYYSFQYYCFEREIRKHLLLVAF